ncbi:hypothetical protein lerEdw1_003162 [Lerista edwardsae]|nr:hypothetical protein lerEdw1_003162 [Lerista edwardsae]
MEPPGQVKDRILQNLSLTVKKLQSYFAACEDETPAIRNHDKVLQRLCEHLDHALLYGLQDLPSGYWVLVVHFTRREAVEQIELLEHVTTNLGRSRAWLYLALNENSLESYLRLFQENLSLLHKYYVRNALVCSHDHLALFLTLVSGLEFIRFDLDLDAPYLDLAPYMPDYYKPQHLLDFEDRLPSSAHGSDSLSLNSFNSATSTNLEWDDSAIAPSSEDYDFRDVFPAAPSLPSAAWEDGDLTDTLSCPHSVASELSSVQASARSPTQRYNPFNGKAEAPSSAETTPVHSALQEQAEGAAEGTDQSESCTELEVIRLAKKKKTGKRRKVKAEEAPSPAPPATAQREPAGAAAVGSRAKQESALEPGPDVCSEAPALGRPRLRIPERKDSSVELVGQALSRPLEAPDQSFRTGAPGEAPLEGPPSGSPGEGVSAPRDFYCFTTESPNSPAPSGGHHDPSRDGQPPHVPGGPEAAGEEEEGGGGGPGGGGWGAAAGPVVEEGAEAATAVSLEALSRLKGDQASPSPSSAEDSGVEDGQGSPSEAAHPSEFR